MRITKITALTPPYDDLSAMTTMFCNVVQNVGTFLTGTITNTGKVSPVEDDYGEGVFGITNQPAIDGTVTKPECLSKKK